MEALAMSVKAPVALTNLTEAIEDIDNALIPLSELLKISTKGTRPIYTKKIDKLLDRRNKLTTPNDV